jgi:CheY-like chemotaxis protein
MPRKRILICDDQQKFIDAFKDAHKDHYKIEEETDIRKLAERIEGNVPDLILLDLYHPKDDKKDFVQRLEEAEEQLEKLDEQIETTKKAVKDAWDSLGIKALKHIREKYGEIPIVIFSQTGPILLDDEEIQSVITNDGYFMLKKEHNMRNMSLELNSIMENKSKLQKLKL